MNCVVCRSKRQCSKSSSVQERARLYLHNQCQTVVLFVQFYDISKNCMAKSWGVHEAPRNYSGD